jgi:hypothetical protein
VTQVELSCAYALDDVSASIPGTRISGHHGRSRPRCRRGIHILDMQVIDKQSQQIATGELFVAQA